MNRKIIILVLAFSMLSTWSFSQRITQPKGGAPGTWRLIGSVQANFKADHDGIVVKGPYDNFRKIKLKVTDAPLNLMKLVVTYDSGVPDEIQVRFNIPKGGESRVIDLPGTKRSIRRIDFWYDTKGILQGKADVTVFGMK